MMTWMNIGRSEVVVLTVTVKKLAKGRERRLGERMTRRLLLREDTILFVHERDDCRSWIV